jgi:hypothetical protein
VLLIYLSILKRSDDGVLHLKKIAFFDFVHSPVFLKTHRYGNRSSFRNMFFRNIERWTKLKKCNFPSDLFIIQRFKVIHLMVAITNSGEDTMAHNDIWSFTVKLCLQNYKQILIFYTGLLKSFIVRSAQSDIFQYFKGCIFELCVT